MQIRSGRAVYLYSTAHKTQVTNITIRGFSTYFTIPQFTTPTRWRIYCYDMTKLIINYDVSTSASKDGIFKLLRSPGIDSMESIPPAYVACVRIL
jgi:hypothetical protein